MLYCMVNRQIIFKILILGVCILFGVRDPGDGGFIPSTQRYYRRYLLFIIT
jgi:hypothetical protein